MTWTPSSGRSRDSRHAGRLKSHSPSTAQPARLTPGETLVATPNPLESIISLAKRRGFVYQAGEIYGGSRSAWDYGPLGTALKENIKREWWKFMVQRRDDIVGIDSSVILP